MKIYHKFLLYQNKLLKPYVRILLGLVEALTYLASLLLIVGVIYEHGFPLSVDEVAKIQVLYKAVWIIFLVDVTLHISLEYRSTKKQYRRLAWILSGLLYLTLIPVIFHRPEEEGAILQFWEFLDGKFYHLVLLLIFSFLNLSNGLVRLLGRRTNPSLILAVSFLAIILIGTGLLMLPRCTVNGITWVDSLFTATSAVCVTGLVPVDVSTTAFCNAGFSTLSGNLGNSMVMTNHNWLFISVSFLIILGGIGFPILVNFKDIVLYHLRHFWKFVRTRKLERHKVSHLYNLNTRIVLIMTFLLLVTGTLAIAAFEWNASFAGMPVADKWTQAFFNATCPRTAGFSSVDLASLSVQTLLVYLVLMWIGGGAQSTAGGVKVNAFAVVVLNLVAVLRGSERVEVFGRELSHDSIRRSNATVVMSLGVLFLFIFILSILEPQASLMALTFECVSALSTVGSSLNLTPNLCDASKLLVALLMFIGRVGLITLMLGIIKQKKNTKYRYPSDNIIIN